MEELGQIQPLSKAADASTVNRVQSKSDCILFYDQQKASLRKSANFCILCVYMETCLGKDV